MTDRSESTTALSILNGPKSFFVTSRLIPWVPETFHAWFPVSVKSRRSMNFLKIQVIQDKSKPTRDAMIWLRVKVNRTRLCTAVLFARNKTKYQKSRENGLFEYKLCAFTITCLSFISLYKGSFTNVTARCPLHRNRRKAKNYHSQYL